MQKMLQQLLCFVISLTFFIPSIQAQFVNFEETWKEFLSDEKTSNISNLTKPSKEDYIDYSKYCLMYANNYFCGGTIGSSEKMMSEVATVGEDKYKTIPGFKEKYDDLSAKILAYHQVEKLWQRFLKDRNISLQDLEVDNATRVCEKGTLAKFFTMRAHAHYCNREIGKAIEDFDNRVIKLVDHTSLKVADVQGLQEEVDIKRALFAGLKKLGPAWKKYLKTDVSPGFDTPLPDIDCFPIPSMKKYLLQAAADLCNSGPSLLEKINKLSAINTHPVSDELAAKIKWLETEVSKNTGDLVLLDKAWKEFVPNNTLKGKVKFGFQYCEKADLIRAYTIVGTIDACTKGQAMLDSINLVRKEHKPELNKGILDKVENLENILKNTEADLENLDTVWKDFVANNDTLTTEFDLAAIYCDKIAQIRSWTIEGHFDYCADGQGYLDKIDALQKQHKLEFDEELACRILRLKIKVWDCRWWELVLQARKETHEERERFGPASAGIMQKDLNSDKQPCETKVKYSPLGNIGIKYIISTYLCQDIDLAKMGDPEYYKKIAAWVDNEVLKKYCEESMRCKEEFFIYLEGHTDGHAFRGARYKNSLEIPLGMPYTHFIDGQRLEKSTEREITTSLKNNMELGIARAWTVKKQLEFMEVPISIGAWEHPESEKGGEFRRIEIELNITKLLLDFYEKRLDTLWKASGIGDRPEEC